jgi:hypothetical protein
LYGRSVAADSIGNAYITGYATSTDFPVTAGAYQMVYNGCGRPNVCSNAFVTKLNPAGSALVYSTYLGGSETDGGAGIAIDSMGNAYVIGSTTSINFPVTSGAFQTTLGSSSGNAFVTEIDPAGSALLFSTYLGGSGGSGGSDIAVDDASNVYVTGTASAGFPVTADAFQTSCCGSFVTKLNATGSALVYSTYLDNGYASGIAVDSKTNAYVIGTTDSTDFPVTAGALQTVCNGGSGCATNGDAFVSELNSEGSALVYSTYLGGSSYDAGYDIALDSADNAYVTGTTESTDFPVTVGAFQTSKKGRSVVGDAFVTKLNPAGSALVYSTYLGVGDQGNGIAVDSSGHACVTGLTTVHLGLTAAFVTKLDPTGSALVQSTTLGVVGRFTGGYGIALDSAGNAYVTGETSSTDFPVTPGAFQMVLNGFDNAFVTKLQLQAATTTMLMSSPNPSTYGEGVTFAAYINSKLGAPPDGEPVTFMKGKTVLGTGTLSGGSASFATSSLPVGTNSITAVYARDSSFAASTSKPVKQVVEPQVPYGVVSPIALNFGSVILGQTSAQKLVSLKNTGNVELTVSDISISGDFALPTNHCANGVKPSTHCNVYITFTPTGLGTATGTLTFTDNASNSPQTVSLAGTGVN